jgi:hypothetical protein
LCCFAGCVVIVVVGVDVDSDLTLYLGTCGIDGILIVKTRLDETEKKMNANNFRSINFSW